MKVMSFSREGNGLEIFNVPIKNDCLRISTDSEGHLILPDHLNNSVVIVDQYGTIKRTVRPMYGTGLEFNYPGAVAVDGLDNMIICDVGNHRVMKFDQDGIFKGFILNKRQHNLWMPHDVVVTNQGHVVLSEVGGTYLKGFEFASGKT